MSFSKILLSFLFSLYLSNFLCADETFRPYSAPPVSLLEMELHPAALPQNAQLSCGNKRYCMLGLNGKFAVGADAVGMIIAPFVPHFDANAQGLNWLVLDGFGGYQFLRDTNVGYSNIMLGYRKLSIRDAENTVFSSGFTFQISFAELITPNYTQGVVFRGFTGSSVQLDNHVYLDKNAYSTCNHHCQLARKSLNYLFSKSKQYPHYYVSFPGQLEVFNFLLNDGEGLTPVRFYANIEPYYLQNNFRVENLFTFTEKSFGLKVMAMAAFQNTQIRTYGRTTLLLGLGADLSHTQFTSISEKHIDLNYEPKKQRVLLLPDLDIHVTYQF